MRNKQVILAERPVGLPIESTFQLVESELAADPGPDVLVETLYLTVDPYMRGLLREQGSGYMEAVQLNQVMHGEGVARVLESGSSEFRAGEIVAGPTRWQQFAILPAKSLRKVDEALGPVSTALGVLGMPGITAYFGLLDLCQPKAGETVVVSGAAGAVGSIVGQIAKIHGCRVIGIAGGKEKCDWIREELRFDEAIDYKSTPDLRRTLAGLCPQGIDAYFDNVGGSITDAVLMNLAVGARISLCGQIAHYNAAAPEMGPRLLFNLIVKQAKIEGFLVKRYWPRAKEATSAIAGWLREGKLKYRETVVEGIENTPRAFLGLFQGENTGKMIVKVAG